VTDLKERGMTMPTTRGPEDLRATIKTRPATETRFRSRTAVLTGQLGRTVQHDDVMNDLLTLADMHPEELAEIARSRQVA
jgi:hypothetical protein